MITVILHPADRFGNYDVELDGEVIVSGSHDPEHAAARVMLAMGMAGPFRTVGPTGRLRMTFPSVEMAARQMVVERARVERRRRSNTVLHLTGGRAGAAWTGSRLPHRPVPSDASLGLTVQILIEARRQRRDGARHCVGVGRGYWSTRPPTHPPSVPLGAAVPAWSEQG